MSNPVKRIEKDGIRLNICIDEIPQNPREWDNLGTMVCGHRRYNLGDEQAKNTELYNSWEEWLENEVIKPNGSRNNVVVLPLYLYDHSGITMNTTGFSCPWDSGQVGWIYCTKERFRKETGYTEDELFSANKHRVPKVGERVKIKGHEDWGQVKEIDGDRLIIDFDYNKIPNFRKPENTIKTSMGNIVEVLSNQAKQILVNEVKTYDQYLRGDVYSFNLEKKEVCNCCGSVEYDMIDSCGGFYGDDFVKQMKEYVSSEYHELFNQIGGM